MKAKVLFIVLLAAAVSATTVFARGSREDTRAPWNRGPEISEKKTEVTGKLSFDDWHPVLKTDKEEYVLMVPGRYRNDIDVKEGDTVQAEGYLVTGAPCCTDENEKALLVTKAVVNGKEYQIDERGWGGMGPWRGGMMGQRYGRPYGGMRGPGMMGPNWGPGPGPRG